MRRRREALRPASSREGAAHDRDILVLLDDILVLAPAGGSLDDLLGLNKIKRELNDNKNTIQSKINVKMKMT